MKTTLTIALVLILVAMLAGMAAAVVSAPWWVCVLNGAVLAWAVPAVLEAIAELWVGRRVL